MAPEPAPPPVIEPLGPTHDRAAFSCGVEALDRYLRQQARQEARARVAAPFVLHLADSSRVIGYYTLSAFAISPTGLAPAVRQRLPRYPLLPVVLLGRFAIDQHYQGQGWGQVLLLDALRRSLEHHREVAAMAVVVNAKDEAAGRFYARYGFQWLAAQPSRLYLPMGTIEQLFREADA